MKSFSEYLEEAVLEESVKAQASVKIHMAIKKCFAKFIKAGCQVMFIHGDRDEADNTSMYLPVSVYEYADTEPLLQCWAVHPTEDWADLADRVDVDEIDPLAGNLAIVELGIAPTGDDVLQKYANSQPFQAAVSQLIKTLSKEFGKTAKKEGGNYTWRFMKGSEVERARDRAETAVEKSIRRNRAKVARGDDSVNGAINKVFGFK